MLAAAIAVSAGLILWLTRGTSFFSDEFTYFVANRGFDVRALLSPHNGHLIAGVRLLYATVFKLFGADYLVFRLLEAVGIAVVAVLFFILAKRRVSPIVALVPSVLLLFMGSAADDTLSPLGLTHVLCVAFGLGALIALERDDRIGDVACCVLLVAAVGTFSIGLAFVAGVAVAVLLRPDRWHRAWIWIAPLALYGAWLLFAPKLTGPTYLSDTHFRLSNALLVPNYIADAAAAVLAAATGLAHDFTNPAPAAAGSAPDIANAWWGYPLAALAVGGLVLRLRAGGVPRSLWTFLAILLAFWASAAMVMTANRYPYSERYVYAGAVVMLLVAVDLVSGVRLSRRLVAVLAAALILALAANIAAFVDSGRVLRSYSNTNRAELAALELARNRVGPSYVPPAPSLYLAYAVVGGAGPVLDAVDRNGSFAFSLSELRSQSEGVREVADRALAGAYGLHVVPAPRPSTLAACRRLPGHRAAPGAVTLRAPRALLRSRAGGQLKLGRFADVPTADAGSLAAGQFAALRIPSDRAPEPWHALVSAPGPLTICPLRR